MVASIISDTSNITKLKSILRQAKCLVVLTGAGISVGSGLPTYRGPGSSKGSSTRAQDFASANAFHRNPSLVWEFFHHRREYVRTKEPNIAHLALAKAESLLEKTGRKMTIITQNIDGLHQKAGSKAVIELHGSLYKTLCLKCDNIEENFDSPICPSLEGRGDPDAGGPLGDIPLDSLPRCKVNNCKGLLRPQVVCFGEKLRDDVLKRTDSEIERCDACLVVGTSSIVYPASKLAPSLALRGVPVAEFNVESTRTTHLFKFHFRGPCTETLPEVLQDIH